MVQTCHLTESSESTNEVGAEPQFHVTYWFFYPYNKGKEVCLIGKVPTPLVFNTCLGRRKVFGSHVGDWEHMSLSFSGNAFPQEMYVSVHDAGVYYKYDPHLKVFTYQRQETRKGKSPSLESTFQVIDLV